MLTKKKPISPVQKIIEDESETKSFRVLSLDIEKDNTETRSYNTDDSKEIKGAAETKSAGMVKIELSKVIEHEGKYYRGVLEVSEELAKKLLDLEKQKI